MRTEDKKVIAFAISDPHFSLERPRNRLDQDWIKAQTERLTTLKYEMKPYEGVPLLIAGDVFDKWDSKAEIVNAVLTRISKLNPVVAVPGQHDLPDHQIELINKSSYLTFCRALKIVENNTWGNDDIYLEGYPWGFGENSFIHLFDDTKKTKIALVHIYCYSGKSTIPGISEFHDIKNIQTKFAGYDFVIIGDHHKPFFLSGVGKKDLPSVINCGGFIGRSIIENDHVKFYWKLYNDKSFEPCSFPQEDHWRVVPEPEIEVSDIGESIKDVAKFLKNVKVGYDTICETLIKACKKQPESVRKLMNTLIDEVSNAD